MKQKFKNSLWAFVETTQSANGTNKIIKHFSIFIATLIFISKKKKNFNSKTEREFLVCFFLCSRTLCYYCQIFKALCFYVFIGLTGFKNILVLLLVWSITWEILRLLSMWKKQDSMRIGFEFLGATNFYRNCRQNSVKFVSQFLENLFPILIRTCLSFLLKCQNFS